MTSDLTSDTADAAEYVEVDPAVLIVGANVRGNVRLDKGFVASIRERGVLEPIVCYRNGEGALVVKYGQRRTLAAVEAGRPTVPVVVVAGAEEPDRVIDQYTENAHRTGLTAGERVDTFRQLAAFGLTAGQIAKRTATRRGEVEAGLTVAASELASAAADRYAFLTLDQAAAVAEFEHDTDAVTALVAAAKQGGFEHVRQRLCDKRDDEAARQAVVAALAAVGVTVVDRPGWEGPVVRLDCLSHDGAPLTAEAHAWCPGHAAFVSQEWVYPDSEDGDGPTREYQAIYVCTDPTGNGHTDTSGRSVCSSERAGPMTDEQKAQRREVIENNKGWRSATTVRRQWLRGFVGRKTAPAGAERFILTALLSGDHVIRQAMETQHGLLRELLGLSSEETTAWGAGAREIDRLVEQVPGHSPKRATLLTAALLLAAWEAKTGTHTWRNPTAETRRYLGQMTAWGYEPSEVEHVAIGPEPQQE